jgi:hypothetical protein
VGEAGDGGAEMGEGRELGLRVGGDVVPFIYNVGSWARWAVGKWLAAKAASPRAL